MQKPKRVMIDPDTGQQIKMPKITSGLINLNINNGGALYNLGTFEIQQGNYASALRCLKAAWDAEKTAEILLNLSTAYKFTGNVSLARKCLSDCIAKYPDFALAYNNLGLIEFDANNFSYAQELYRTAIKLKPDYADAHWNLSLALGLDYFSVPSSGSLEEVVKEYSWRFNKTNPVSIARTIGTNEWDGSELGDKKLLIICEQGLGDMIQFMRYAYTFDPKNIILHLPESLHPLVKKPYQVTNVSTVDHDYWIPMCSLLKYVPVGTGSSYISGFGSRELEGTFKIGIVWKGSAKHQNDKNRSMHYRDFYWLFKYGTVYSLQYDTELPKSVKDIHKCNIRTWVDTAEYINSMDVIVTVDTSVAHLAGALGKRCITLIPGNGIDWRWGKTNEKCVWYDSMTLVRNRSMERAEELVREEFDKKFIYNGLGKQEFFRQVTEIRCQE